MSSTCSTVQIFDPPVKLSKDEVRRIEEYSFLLVFSSHCTTSPFPPDGAAGERDVSPTGNEVRGSSLSPHRPGGNNNHDGAGLSAGTSLALQALYASDAVKRAFADFDQPSMTLDSGSDDDDDDDN